MDDHASEEDRVEPRERAVKTGDETPRKSEEEIAGVVDLPGLSIPSIAQDAVSLLGGDGLGVVDLAVLEVGEGGALLNNAAFFLAELVLLRVGGVPDVVDAEISDDHEGNDPGGKLILGGVVESDVECAVAV